MVSADANNSAALIGAQNHQGQLAFAQVLLIADSLIGSKEYLKPGVLRRLQ